MALIASSTAAQMMRKERLRREVCSAPGTASALTGTRRTRALLVRSSAFNAAAWAARRAAATKSSGVA